MSQNVNILRVIHSLNPSGGGPAEGIRQITPVLTTMGHQTTVLCLDPKNAYWLEEFPCKVIALGQGWTGYGFSYQWLIWLHQNLSRFNCVIIHGVWQFQSFGTWLLLRRYSIPYYIYPHGMLDPWFRHTYPIKHIKKQVYWLLAEFHVLRYATSVLFTCEEERQLAHHCFWPYICTEKVINYGTSPPPGNIESQKRIFLERFSYLKGKRIILFLGRLHPKKGCDILIQAFAKITTLDSDLHLVLAGPDQTGWQITLEQMAKELSISHFVSFTGMLQGDLKWGAFHNAEVFILPSHQENFGIAVVEALACQLPVLISDKVNIWPEVISDGAGLVAEDNVDGTLDLLQQWLHMPTQKYHAMKNAAGNCFVKRFEINRSAQSLASLLLEKNQDFTNNL